MFLKFKNGGGKMINFQCIVNSYKDAKRKTVRDIRILLCLMKEDDTCFSLSYLRRCTVSLSLFKVNIERDLGAGIPLLGKIKEKLQDAKRHLDKGDKESCFRNIHEAEKFFLEFNDLEFEKKLAIALRRCLKEVQL